MKITVFNGSPSGENSATAVMANAFLEGAAEAGAETEQVFLIDEHIEYCRGCFSCWFATPGKCVHQDGMGELLKKYMESDVVVFGTPVFTWDMTAVMKNFVDRLIALKSPVMTQKNGHMDMEDAMPKQQKFAVMSNCGFPGEHNFDVIKEVFKSCEPCLEIYRNCGKLLKSKNEAVQGIVAEYLKAVKQAGFEMADDGEVSAETLEALNKPLMSIGEYAKFLGM